MSTIPCADAAGSINNTSAPAQGPTVINPYTPVDVCIGTWQISTKTGQCATNETNIQKSYAAENININGAPLRIYKLLGVHEQGNGSVLNSGKLFASAPSPGYPASGINTGGSWKSVQTGSAVAGNAWVGLDFGIILNQSGQSNYQPSKSNFAKVGAISLQQSNDPFSYARQVRVDITDGKMQHGDIQYSGLGTGTLNVIGLGSDIPQMLVVITATSPTTFDVSGMTAMGAVAIGTATVGTSFYSDQVQFTITAGTIPFAAGDSYSFNMSYVWQRAAVFNLTQSAVPTVLNLQTQLTVNGIRVVPTLFTGTSNWEVLNFDVLDSPPTDINNIQDLFFGENRDRDYAKVPIDIKGMYTMSDSIADLSRFGLSILDQYSFVASWDVIVAALGRGIVTGDIIEVVPELQYDQNLRPIRKFVEVTDTGWAADGFTSNWTPALLKFSAQQALPSQETRDIFGTIDTQKYVTADSIFTDGIGEQIDITPLSATENTMREVEAAVPKTGSNDQQSILGAPIPAAHATVNVNGQPDAITVVTTGQSIYIEDGLPPDNLPYGEGYVLPDAPVANDGDYYRLLYPKNTNIPARLYRFSALKNRWIYVETDRRGQYSSAKSNMLAALQSPTNQSLTKK